MKLKDYFRLGLDQLRRRKVVTALCALGIAIGSASIVVALAFGESIQHYTQEQMKHYLKTDEITIRDRNGSPGGGAADGRSSNTGRITKEKLDLIRTFPHVKSVASFRNLQQFQYTVDGKQGYFDIIATELDTLADFGSEFQQGGSTDMHHSIIVNYGATVGLFDAKTSEIRSRIMQENPSKEMMETFRQMDLLPFPMYQKQIKLQKTNHDEGANNDKQAELSLRISGVLKKPEGLPDYMLGNKAAYVSPETGRKLAELFYGGADNGQIPLYSEVRVKVDSSANVKQVEEMIQKLRLETQSNLYQEDRMKGEFVIIRLLLTGVGLFVLFVASISIVVAMTMSTYQRRRQIGIMKVLGANLRQIRNMFIMESSLLGLLGGAIGILLSYWVIWGINLIILRFSDGPPGSNPEILFISLWILPVGMFFALMTGVLSGLYPAVKASRTDALTAIKRE